jgi:serine/threonine protein kinase
MQLCLVLDYLHAQTTPRADIYSLGAVLHQLLTAAIPQKRSHPFYPWHHSPDIWKVGRITGWIEALMENAPQTFRSYPPEERMTILQEV